MVIFSQHFKDSIRYKENSMGKEASFQQMVLGQLYIHMQKSEVGPLPHTIYKNSLKMNQKTNWKN